MDQEQFDRIDQVLEVVLGVEPSERADFLKQACDGDDALLREVERLLSCEGEAAQLEHPALAFLAEGFTEQANHVFAGRQISHFVIKERIGAGGMGEVWRAWDEQVKRDVAIKILPPEFAADPERVRRFEHEAYTVSRLNHSNIVTIHDVGQVAGPSGDLHFIVTELIEGQTLREMLNGSSPLSWRDSALIAAQIAGALNAAHLVGIIHRDIKPENIMALKGGHVKVLDFGVAKLVNAATTGGEDLKSSVAGVETRFGVRTGTLKYMSPEQVRGERLDARTDIFSLGLTLYEMIVGRHPFDGCSDEEIIEALKSDDDIPAVCEINGDIPAALDRVTTKAIRKNREHRYASVCEMLADLNRLKTLIKVVLVEKEEKQLRAQSADQLLTQYVVFHESEPKTRIPLGALLSIARFAGLQRGKKERALIRKSLFNGLLKASRLVLLIAGLALLLAAALSEREEFEEQVMRNGHTAAVRRAAFSPDGRLLVSVGEDNKVIVWDFARREQLATFNDHTDWVTAVAFSPDGKWFATGSYDKTVIVWDAVKLRKETVLRGHSGKVVLIGFTPDGKKLVSAVSQPDRRDDATILWRVDGWERFAQVPVEGGDAGSLLFPPGSARMIYHYGGSHASTNTWDTATGQPLGNQFDPAWKGNNAALSPDGALLVSVNGDGEVIFADFKGRRTLSRERAHQDNGRAVAFSTDGRFVATGAENIILWDAATRRRITTIDYPSIVWSAAFSPDGHGLVTTHGDGSIGVWDLVERRHAVGFNEHHGAVRAVAWSHDGKRFASAGEDRAVMVWNAESQSREKLLVGHQTRVTGLTFAPDGSALASVDRDGTIIIWDLTQGRERLNFGHPVRKDAPGSCVAFSPDGRILATSHGVYESDTGRQLANFDCESNWLKSSAIYGLDFSANGKLLADASIYGLQFVCDTATWQIIERAGLSPRSFISVSFSPDGKQLVTGEDGGTVQLWTAQPLRPTAVIGRHDARIKSVAFSPDGRQVVSAGDDKMIALWDVAARKLVARIGVHTAPVYAVAFSPDGRQLVSGGHDHSVRLYTRRHSLWGFRWN